MDLRRLIPECGPTTVDELLDDLRLSGRAPESRPYVVLNMVGSIDGRATIEGRVGALTSPVDQRIVYKLRTEAEALLVGAGTVRNERYADLIPPDLSDHRPLVVIVTRRVDLPPDLPLLHEPETRIVIATSSEGTLGFQHEASVTYLRVPAIDGRADVAAILAGLRRDHGVRSVICEGGPMLNESLLGEAVVDELFLSLSPLVVGGAERALADTVAGMEPRRARLLSAATADDYLFLRYEL